MKTKWELIIVDESDYATTVGDAFTPGGVITSLLNQRGATESMLLHGVNLGGGVGENFYAEIVIKVSGKNLEKA